MVMALSWKGLTPMVRAMGATHDELDRFPAYSDPYEAAAIDWHAQVRIFSQSVRAYQLVVRREFERSRRRAGQRPVAEPGTGVMLPALLPVPTPALDELSPDVGRPP